MADPPLPPSRFSAGFTVGASVATAPRSAAAPDHTNKTALTAFVAVLVLGMFVAPITLAAAFVAEGQIRRASHKGAGLATAAKVISTIYLLVGLVALGLWLYIRTRGRAG